MAKPKAKLKLTAEQNRHANELARSAWDFALIALAAMRSDDTRYSEALEEAAQEFEGALSAGNGWIKKLLRGR